MKKMVLKGKQLSLEILEQQPKTRQHLQLQLADLLICNNHHQQISKCGMIIANIVTAELKKFQRERIIGDVSRATLKKLADLSLKRGQFITWSFHLVKKASKLSRITENTIVARPKKFQLNRLIGNVSRASLKELADLSIRRDQFAIRRYQLVGKTSKCCRHTNNNAFAMSKRFQLKRTIVDVRRATLKKLQEHSCSVTDLGCRPNGLGVCRFTGATTNTNLPNYNYHGHNNKIKGMLLLDPSAGTSNTNRKHEEVFGLYMEVQEKTKRSNNKRSYSHHNWSKPQQIYTRHSKMGKSLFIFVCCCLFLFVMACLYVVTGYRNIGKSQHHSQSIPTQWEDQENAVLCLCRLLDPESPSICTIQHQNCSKLCRITTTPKSAKPKKFQRERIIGDVSRANLQKLADLSLNRGQIANWSIQLVKKVSKWCRTIANTPFTKPKKYQLNRRIGEVSRATLQKLADSSQMREQIANSRFQLVKRAYKCCRTTTNTVNSKPKNFQLKRRIGNVSRATLKKLADLRFVAVCLVLVVCFYAFSGCWRCTKACSIWKHVGTHHTINSSTSLATSYKLRDKLNDLDKWLDLWKCITLEEEDPIYFFIHSTRIKKFQEITKIHTGVLQATQKLNTFPVSPVVFFLLYRYFNEVYQLVMELQHSQRCNTYQHEFQHLPTILGITSEISASTDQDQEEPQLKFGLKSHNCSLTTWHTCNTCSFLCFSCFFFLSFFPSFLILYAGVRELQQLLWFHRDHMGIEVQLIKVYNITKNGVLQRPILLDYGVAAPELQHWRNSWRKKAQNIDPYIHNESRNSRNSWSSAVVCTELLNCWASPVTLSVFYLVCRCSKELYHLIVELQHQQSCNNQQYNHQQLQISLQTTSLSKKQQEYLQWCYRIYRIPSIGLGLLLFQFSFLCVGMLRSCNTWVWSCSTNSLSYCITHTQRQQESIRVLNLVLHSRQYRPAVPVLSLLASLVFFLCAGTSNTNREHEAVIGLYMEFSITAQYSTTTSYRNLLSLLVFLFPGIPVSLWCSNKEPPLQQIVFWNLCSTHVPKFLIIGVLVCWAVQSRKHLYLVAFLVKFCRFQKFQKSALMQPQLRHGHKTYLQHLLFLFSSFGAGNMKLYLDNTWSSPLQLNIANTEVTSNSHNTLGFRNFRIPSLWSSILVTALLVVLLLVCILSCWLAYYILQVVRMHPSTSNTPQRSQSLSFLQENSTTATLGIPIMSICFWYFCFVLMNLQVTGGLVKHVTFVDITNHNIQQIQQPAAHKEHLQIQNERHTQVLMCSLATVFLLCCRPQLQLIIGSTPGNSLGGIKLWLHTFMGPDLTPTSTTYSILLDLLVSCFLGFLCLFGTATRNHSYNKLNFGILAAHMCTSLQNLLLVCLCVCLCNQGNTYTWLCFVYICFAGLESFNEWRQQLGICMEISTTLLQTHQHTKDPMHNCSNCGVPLRCIIAHRQALQMQLAGTAANAISQTQMQPQLATGPLCNNKGFYIGTLFYSNSRWQAPIFSNKIQQLQQPADHSCSNKIQQLQHSQICRSLLQQQNTST